MCEHVRTVELQRMPLDAAFQTIGHILSHHHQRLTGSLPDKDASEDLHTQLMFFESSIGNLRFRSIANKERLLNEVQLAFDSVAQYDTGISIEIGRATQSDSAAMKTIVSVTMAFLPPTFICAIFSMPFFFSNSDSGEWAMLDGFWIYWAFAIPTTLVAFEVWYLWQRRTPDSLKKLGELLGMTGIHQEHRVCR